MPAGRLTSRAIARAKAARWSSPEATPDQEVDGHLAHEGLPEVTLHYASKPEDVLDRQGLPEAEILTKGAGGLRARARSPDITIAGSPGIIRMIAKTITDMIQMTSSICSERRMA